MEDIYNILAVEQDMNQNGKKNKICTSIGRDSIIKIGPQPRMGTSQRKYPNTKTNKKSKPLKLKPKSGATICTSAQLKFTAEGDEH